MAVIYASYECAIFLHEVVDWFDNLQLEHPPTFSFIKFSRVNFINCFYSPHITTLEERKELFEHIKSFVKIIEKNPQNCILYTKDNNEFVRFAAQKILKGF